MWDVQKYNSIINAIKKKGTFMGRNATTKEEIYKLIGEAIHRDMSTVKSWQGQQAMDQVIMSY